MQRDLHDGRQSGTVRLGLARARVGMAAVYPPRAGNSITLVPKLKRAGSNYEFSAETVLCHEYAHHLMATLTSRTFPRWFVEGFADFFAGARTGRNTRG